MIRYWLTGGNWESTKLPSFHKIDPIIFEEFFGMPCIGKLCHYKDWLNLYSSFAQKICSVRILTCELITILSILSRSGQCMGQNLLGAWIWSSSGVKRWMKTCTVTSPSTGWSVKKLCGRNRFRMGPRPQKETENPSDIFLNTINPTVTLEGGENIMIWPFNKHDSLLNWPLGLSYTSKLTLAFEKTLWVYTVKPHVNWTILEICLPNRPWIPSGLRCRSWTWPVKTWHFNMSAH